MTTNTSSRLEWVFQHDEVGRVERLCDPGGKETVFDYEAFPGEPGRLKSVTRRFPSGASVFEFDRRGRRTTLRDGAGIVCYEWDDLGRLAHVERQGGTRIEYRYDSLGRLQAYSLGGANAVEYAYDFLGRLESMRTPAGTIRYEHWTGQAKTVRILPNGIRTFWDHAPDGRLAVLTHVDRESYVIAKFTYTYRPDGLIAAILEWSPRGERNLTFIYDQGQRLVAVDDSTGRRWQAEYDPFGNRTRAGWIGEPSVECRYDWAGRMIAWGGEACEHDPSGNLVRVRVGGRQRRFDYDHDNRLQRVDQGEVSYEYDGDGALIARTVRGERTAFVPDPWADLWRPLLATAPGGRQRFYIWQGRVPLMVVEGGRVSFFLEDHLGSVRCVVDASGKVTERRDYSAFGEYHALADGTDLIPGFAGLFWDGVASVYISRARAYSPESGRFHQIDPQHRLPLGSQKDASVYSYCGNDPINFFDLTGAAAARPQANDRTGEIAAWLIKTLRSYEERAARDLYPSEDPSRLTFRQRSAVRKLAVDNFADDYSSYVFWGPGGGLEATLDKYVGNRNVWTPYGWASVDWLTTIIDSGNKPPGWLYSDPWQRYFAGKTLHNFLSPLLGIKEHSQKGNEYPENNWNALLVQRDLFNPNIAFENLFWNPPVDLQTSIPSGDVGIGRQLSPPSPSTNRGLVGVSVHASAIPLTRAEYAEWKARKRSKKRKRSGKPGPSDSGGGGGDGGGGDNDDEAPPPPGGGGGGGGGGGPRQPPPPGGGGGGGGEDSGGGGGQNLLSATSPSPVGGVYLRGASKVIAGLGQLKGVALDRKTGTLVLLAERAGDVQLPALRLDDVVTIFRSVYLHGEGPSVTINPRPDDPHGPVMDVVHGEGTRETYVGWVLFQADRIMKCYNLGRDNVSNTTVTSAVLGYERVLDTIFFGGDFSDGKRPGGTWERFWIVPAEVNQFRAPSRTFTLLDLPLKIRTQKMILKKGKLEDDSQGQSSRGALAFVDWFTRNYEGITGERFLEPPPETGITTPVPVFAELRRIALLTAIAEQLRDQGVPLPSWMKEYHVERVPVTATTPAMNVSAERTVGQQVLQASIYGGVNLSPANAVVRRFDGSADLDRLPSAARETWAREIRTIEALASEIEETARAGPPFIPRVLWHQGREFQAVALPGPETKALAPCRLQEFDLEIVGEDGVRIALVRSYNSFFQPTSEWGRGWTMDLPRLERVRVPLERTDAAVRYKIAYELSTPLDSIRARFSDNAPVPELDATLLVPDRPCGILAVAEANDPLVERGKTRILFKDGRSWYFDEQGNFVAEQAKPWTVLYRRDSASQVGQIAGYHGDRQVAAISLSYGAHSRLESAEIEPPPAPRDDGKVKLLPWFSRLFSRGRQTAGGEPAARVSYQYDCDGRLAAVLSPEGKLSYDYDHSLVKAVHWSPAGEEAGEPELLRQYEYAANGQLRAETDEDGTRIAYEVERQGETWRIATTPEGRADEGHAATYDASLRPLEWTTADNVTARWDYAPDGSTTLTTWSPEGDVVRTVLSGDGKWKTLHHSNGATEREGYDEGGRLTSFDRDGRRVFSQQWHQNGLLRSMDCDTHSVLPRYDRFGRRTGILRVKPATGDSYSEWQETEFDEVGRVKAVKDYRGTEVRLTYHAGGGIASLITKREGKDLQCSVKRNARGQVEQVQTPWGEESYSYDAVGNLARVRVKKPAGTAAVEYAEGRIESVTQFDGGSVRYRYSGNGEAQGRLEALETPILALRYRYGPDGVLRAVECNGTCSLSYAYDAQGRLERLAWTPLEG